MDVKDQELSQQMSGLCGVWIGVTIVGFIVGSFCWTYSINHWLQWADKTPVVQWWQGGLIGMVPYIGPFSIPAAVITWIIGLFM